MRFQGEVTCVEEADLRVRQVALVGFSARGQEKRIVLAPNRKQRRAVRAEVGLEPGIGGDIRLIDNNRYLYIKILAPADVKWLALTQSKNL